MSNKRNPKTAKSPCRFSQTVEYLQFQFVFNQFPLSFVLCCSGSDLFVLACQFTPPFHISFITLQRSNMYHVASPRSTHQHRDMYQHQHPAAPLPNLQLPRTLNRPAFTEVQRDAILAVEPNLGQVPFEYIRKGLHARGEECVFLAIH